MTPTPHSKIKKEKRKKPNYKAIKEAVEEIKKRAKPIKKYHYSTRYLRTDWDTRYKEMEEAIHRDKVMQRKKDIRSEEFKVILEKLDPDKCYPELQGNLHMLNCEHKPKQSLWSRIKKFLIGLMHP